MPPGRKRRAGPDRRRFAQAIPGFITAGSNWSIYGQTGTPSDCGLTNPPGTFNHGVAIVITILNPNFDAFLGVSDINSLSTTLSTVALNYTHGQGLSTMYIVPQLSTNIILLCAAGGIVGAPHLRRRGLLRGIRRHCAAMRSAKLAPAAIAAASTGR